MGEEPDRAAVLSHVRAIEERPERSGRLRARRATACLFAIVLIAVLAATGAAAQQRHDLAVDESMGGHTLARHVGKTDAELAERLRRERGISAASTYTDRATAERSVGGALSDGGRKLADWQKRSGNRPNLVLHYAEPLRRAIGRSLMRGRSSPVPCTRAIVVLRWNERTNRFYVLTSYPEADR